MPGKRRGSATPATACSGDRSNYGMLRQFHGVAMLRIPGTRTRDTAPRPIGANPVRLATTSRWRSTRPAADGRTSACRHRATPRYPDREGGPATRLEITPRDRSACRTGEDTSRNADPGEVLRVPGRAIHGEAGIAKAAVLAHDACGAKTPYACGRAVGAAADSGAA